MSSGYAGAFAVTIEDKAVQKVVGDDLWSKYIHARAKVDEETICDDAYDPDDDDFEDDDEANEAKKNTETFFKALNRVTKAFKKATKLPLYRNVHNGEDKGDCYDDVNGAFWAIDFSRAYIQSPALKAFNRKMKGDGSSISHYVTFV